MNATSRDRYRSPTPFQYHLLAKATKQLPVRDGVGVVEISNITSRIAASETHTICPSPT